MTFSLGLFKNSTDVTQYLHGETIFKEGDEAHALYVVTEGEVDIVLNGQVIETVTEGGVFGELALIDKAPRSATAVARSTAKVVPINERRFTFLVTQTPNFALQVMRVLTERLRRHDPPHGT